MTAAPTRTVKALTVHQPWAWLMVHSSVNQMRINWHGERRRLAIKTVENRAWATKHRGRLAIHAGKRAETCHAMVADGRYEALMRRCGLPRMLPFGAVVGTVEVVDVVRVEDWQRMHRQIFGRDDPFAWGPWCWVMVDPQPLAQPSPAVGQVGLWGWEPRPS